MAILKVGKESGNLTALPDPKAKGGLKVSLQDIDASTTTRSANGTLLRDRVVGGASAKRKLEIEWPPMRSEDMSRILQAISPEFFWVEYPDPYTGTTRQAQFYAGDRSAPMYHANLHGQGPMWESLSVNFIEK